MSPHRSVYELVNEYEFGGATAGQAYAMAAMYFDIPVSRVLELCDQRATEVLEARRVELSRTTGGESDE